MPDPAADVVDVGIDPLAEIRHLVDEADLCRQQRVGDILRHFRALRRHRQKRMLRAEVGGIEIPEQIAIGGGADPDDNPVGPLEVVDRGSFLEKLRIARHPTGPARRGKQSGLDPGTRPHRDGALRDDHRRRIDVRCDRFSHLPEGREISRAISRRRGADSEEDDLSTAHRRRSVGGEPKTAGADVAFDEFLEPGLIDRDVAAIEPGNLIGVDIEAGDNVAAVRKTGSRDEANVARSHDCDPHHDLSNESGD